MKTSFNRPQNTETANDTQKEGFSVRKKLIVGTMAACAVLGTSACSNEVPRPEGAPSYEELTPFQQQHFFELNEDGELVSSEEAYYQTMENLYEAEPTVEGFQQFEAGLQGIYDDIQANGWGHPYLYPSDKTYEETPPRVTLHFTAWPEEAWDKGGLDFAESQYNACMDGACGSASAYIDREGGGYKLIPDEKVANHAKSYSVKSRGIETPAFLAQDVSPEQYEGMIYMAAHWYLKDRPDGAKPLTEDEAKEYIIGHGEITELKHEGDHTDFLLPVADAVALKFRALTNEVIAGRE